MNRAVRVEQINRKDPGLISGKQVELQPLVPMGGGQLVPAGDAFAFFIERNMKLVLLTIDIPAGVEFDLLIDRASIVTGADLQGLQYAIPMGEMDGSVVTPANRIDLTGTNLNTSAVDVRAWATVAL